MTDRAAAEIRPAIEPVPAFLIRATPPIKDDIRQHFRFYGKPFVAGQHFFMQKCADDSYGKASAAGAGKAFAEGFSWHRSHSFLRGSTVSVQFFHYLFKYLI